MPCRVAVDLDCVFPIWIAQCHRVWFTHTMPYPYRAPTMPLCMRLLKATAQHGRGTAWYVRINIGRERAYGRYAQFRFLPTATRSSAIGSLDFSGYTRNFTKGMTFSADGRGQGVVCVNQPSQCCDSRNCNHFFCSRPDQKLTSVAWFSCCAYHRTNLTRLPRHCEELCGVSANIITVLQKHLHFNRSVSASRTDSVWFLSAF
jgi:hypothetical protein